MREARHGSALAAALAVALLARPAVGQEPVVDVDPRLPFATRQIVERSLAGPEAEVETGATVVAREEARPGSIVQLGGSILLEGRIEGDVLAVDSEVTLKPSAVIGGRLTVMAGRYFGTTMAETGEETVWLPEARVVVEAVADTVRVRYVPEKRPFPVGLGGVFGLVLHEYNGVDGLAFGVEAALRDLEGHPPTELGGGPVFRTERMEDVGWWIGGFREFSRLKGLRLGAGAHSITDTAQRWHRPDFGNSVAALLFANDDRAYHERTGYEAWVERTWVLTPVTVRVGWRDDEFDSLASESPFVLFGGDEDWPVNPEIDPGRGRALGVRAAYDRRLDEEGLGPRPGLYLEGRYDRWGFGGDFEFDHGQLDARAYVPAGASVVSLRLAAGGRLGGADTLAPQFLYRLGGAGSVIGYDGLSERLTGDRMALANLRVHLALPGRRFMDRLYLVGLADVGDAWVEEEPVRWNAGLGAGLAGHGRRAYLGVFAGYGLESEEWHVYVLARPWF
ncbi:MAG TPA: BamA/TamA family outer membrane protein [Gemmatimonadota bacterium]|nr:BamA/TamA family outer membrane protein [Gemmatimonadota bacterium]